MRDIKSELRQLLNDLDHADIFPTSVGAMLRTKILEIIRMCDDLELEDTRG